MPILPRFLISSATAAFSLALPAQEEPTYEPQPLPAGPEARTQADHDAAWETLLSESLVLDHSIRCGPDALDPGFAELLRAWGRSQLPHRNWILGRMRAAIHRGVDDPLMDWLRGEMLVDDEERQEWFERACRGLDRTGAMPLVRFFVRHRFWQFLRYKQRAGADLIRELMIEDFVGASADPRMKGGNQRQLIRMFGMLWSQETEQSRAVVNRMLAQDRGDRYAALVLDARHHIDAAWDARTSRAARDVTEEGWKGFHEHLEKAAASAVAAHEIHPDFPEAPTKMIKVCGGLGAIDAIRGWLDAAVAAELDHYPAYYAALHFYSVRWGGDLDLQYDLGVECLKADRFETLLPHVFRHALGVMANDLADAGDVFGGRTPRILDRLHEKRMAALNEPQNVTWELSRRATDLIMTDRAQEGVLLAASIPGGFQESAAAIYGAREAVALARKALPVEHAPETYPPIDLFAGWETATYPGSDTAQPLPAASDRPLHMEVQQTFLQQYTAMVLDHHERHATDSGELRADAASAIGKFMGVLSRAPGAPRVPEYTQELESLIAAGCEDPIVAYYHGRMLELYRRVDDAVAAYGRALAAFEQGGYAPSFPFAVKRRLAAIARAQGATAKAEALSAEVSSLALRMARMPEWQGDGRAHLLQTVWRDEGAPFARGDLTSEDIRELAQDEDVDPWVRHMLVAWDHLHYGVHHPFHLDERDEPMFEHLAIAERELRAAHALHPELPHAACGMILVSDLVGTEEPSRDWFDQAVAAQFDYPSAYEFMATSLTATYGGTRQQLLRFAIECLDTERFDTLVPNTLMTALFKAVSNDGSILRWTWASPSVAAAFDRLLEGSRGGPREGGLREMELLVHWAGGRYDRALEAWRRNGRQLVDSNYTQLYLDPDEARADMEFLDRQDANDTGPETDRGGK